VSVGPAWRRSCTQTIGILSLGTISDLTREIAVNTASISSIFNTAMADSLILAAARAYKAALCAQDAGFEGIGGVQYIVKKG
jgi:predicted nucleic acid-binding protein